MDWDDLQTFQAIARHGSLSAAARALGVRQSTMGRRLAALERRFGHQLLQRTPHGFLPTQAGEAILGHVERIEHETLAIGRTLTGQDSRLAGTIRLTAVETLAVEVLTPLLGTFAARHPGIEVELLADFRSLSLTRREADLAVRLARPTREDLAARKVGDITFGFYAAAIYLERHGMPDFSAGAAGHRIILNPEDLMPATPEVRQLAALAGRAQVALRSASRYAQRAACQAGMGIACLADYLADGAGLVPVAAPVMPAGREIWLAVHADMRHMPRIRALSDHLAEGLGAMAGRLARQRLHLHPVPRSMPAPVGDIPP